LDRDDFALGAGAAWAKHPGDDDRQSLGLRGAIAMISILAAREVFGRKRANFALLLVFEPG
jgi:hypothetical protein